MTQRDTKRILIETGNIIKNHKYKISNIEKMYEDSNANDSKNKEIKLKLDKMKNRAYEEYTNALNIVDVITSLESMYSHILYEIYINGKREKQVDAYKGCSRSTTNRIHLKAIEMFIEKCKLLNISLLL